MEYKCSGCGYSSPKKNNVVRHINKKVSCFDGIKEILESVSKIKCEYCDKFFLHLGNLNCHLKKCEAENAKIKSIFEENMELKKQIKKIQNSLIINNTTNNTNNNIVIINNYEKTSYEKLQNKDICKIIIDAEESYRIVPSIVKETHFNPKIPENHNVYLSNRSKNNKHLNVYAGGWGITNKDDEIDNMIHDKETHLADWAAEYGEKYPEALERLNEYMESKYDDDMIKLVREGVEHVLYNGRHIFRK